ncbi:hypothetical protein AXF42_Ash015299 [Apostasia shenzhenica]|uniref:C2H2-type domain-containing protein n=1 Tax=Apostasia shenzhenica TaxID=1088818 RepID=A0A2I0AM35_9ASPA|nr:hypothetical protein AXF42_Ash015299 [Apostasia shenzhenica]
MESTRSEEPWLGFPFWVAVRRRLAPDDVFFSDGNIERELLAKQVAIDLTDTDRYQLQKITDAGGCLQCPIVGCGAHLNYLEDFEDHYHARHMSACAVCSRVYPTSRLLSIHVSEVHDSFFQAKVARGFPMYQCLVEGCGAKLKSYKSRQQHLVQKHKFPTSFDFFKKARPSKHQRQKHHRGDDVYKSREAQDMDVDRKTFRSQQRKYLPKLDDQNAEQSQVDGMEVEEMNKLVSAVSKLSTSNTTTPSAISFGHRHSRGFTFVPRAVRQSAEHQSDAKG